MAALHIPVGHSKRWTLRAAILLTIFLGTSLALAQDRVGAYDFAYRLAGDARARPVQVFDDGRETFFQFRPGEPLPAIFADDPAGPRLMPPKSDGPYAKVPALADGFSLRLGLGAATVTYIGAPRRIEAPSPTTSQPPEPVRRAPLAASTFPALQLAASQPVSGLPREPLLPTRSRITLEEGSYATPLKGDAIEWTTAPERVRLIDIVFGKDSAALTPGAMKQVRSAVTDARGSSRFELAARDDPNHRPGLANTRVRAVQAALLAAGAAPHNIVHKGSPGDAEAGASPGTGVTLRVVDATTSAMPVQPSPQRTQRSAAAASVVESRAPEFSLAATPPVQMQWAVRKSDGTLDRMLARWAKDAGWTLVWQNGPTVAITGDASLTRTDYIQAADYALEQARGAGYRLRAMAYSNHVLVVTNEE